MIDDPLLFLHFQMDYSGKLNEDNMQNITTKIFPKEAVEKLMTKVDKCTEEMGGNDIINRSSLI
jgi:hypothetical protein